MIVAAAQIGCFWYQLRLISGNVEDTKRIALYRLRPKLRIRRVSIDGNGVRYVIANIGVTDERLTGGNASVLFREHKFVLPNFPQPIEQVNIDQKVIAPRQEICRHVENADAIHVFDFTDPFPVHSRMGSLYFHGWIRYADDLGNVRETSFCRKHGGTKFVRVHSRDHKYED